MTRKRKFRDPTMQAAYNDMVALPEEKIARVLMRGGSQDSAFADGFEGYSQEGIRDYRRTWAYAAWCAGKDHPNAVREKPLYECGQCHKKKNESRMWWCEKIDNFICDSCCTSDCDGCSTKPETKKAPSK